MNKPANFEIQPNTEAVGIQNQFKLGKIMDSQFQLQLSIEKSINEKWYSKSCSFRSLNSKTSNQMQKETSYYNLSSYIENFDPITYFHDFTPLYYKNKKLQLENVDANKSLNKGKDRNIENIKLKDEDNQIENKRVNIKKCNQLNLIQRSERNIPEKNKVNLEVPCLSKRGRKPLISKKFICLICGKRFSTPAAKGGHTSKAHPGQSIKYNQKVKIRDRRTNLRNKLLNAKIVYFKEFYELDYLNLFQKDKNKLKRIIEENFDHYKHFIKELS